VRLRVQPRASREGIEGGQAGVWRVRVSAPPVDGDANRAVLALLARALGVRAGALSIAQGARGRDKLVRVEGLSPADVEARLGGSRRGARGGGGAGSSVERG
jgi:uncharacterized protein (TIGR00251 family)